MTVPVSVHGFGEHIALLFHLVKQRQQRPAPAAALRLLGDEEIRVHHLHPEADAEHGLAGPRRIVHDLKMIRIKPRAAAEHERIAQLQRTFDHIAVAAQNADGRAAGCELALLPYENEHALSLRRAVGEAAFETVSIMTGPEGGFSEDEVRLAQEAGMQICTLGPRILRCETAPLCALSAVLYAAGALD